MNKLILSITLIGISCIINSILIIFIQRQVYQNSTKIYQCEQNQVDTLWLMLPMAKEELSLQSVLEGKGIIKWKRLKK